MLKGGTLCRIRRPNEMVLRIYDLMSVNKVFHIYEQNLKKMSRDVKRTVLARRILAVYFLALFVSNGVKTFELPV